MTDYTTLEVTRSGQVGWLVFDRPDRGNAIDATMFDELEAAWAELDADADVRVIVNTGNGPAFQTGLDVAQLAADREALRKSSSRQTRDFELRMTAWHCGVGKPVIAAVNGTCAGGGLHFVADADIVIAADGGDIPRPARVGRSGVGLRDDRARQEVADGVGVAHGTLTGRHERITAARAPPTRHRVGGGAPPTSSVTGPGNWASCSPPSPARATGGHEAGPCGPRSSARCDDRGRCPWRGGVG